jgi:hypothetical protein
MWQSMPQLLAQCVEQIASHEAPPMELPEPFIDTSWGDLLVVRDDLLPGGTKLRYLVPLLASDRAQEFVYASPAYGYAQIALAHACKMLGKRATIFAAKRNRLHRRQEAAKAAGARIMLVPNGYLTVVQKAAREYCAVSGARLIPFGVDTPEAIEAFADCARALPIRPLEVWCVAGSGTLARGLQAAWPGAKVFAIQVGRAPNAGRAEILLAPEAFEDDAKHPPPFPSCSNYDAKAWRFLRRARPGALFWNVAA